MGMIHTHFRKGQRVRVTMKDGDVYVDKYEDTKSGCVILRDHGKVKVNKIRNISINRPMDAPHIPE